MTATQRHTTAVAGRVRVVDRARDENFTVASLLLPRDIRAHLFAIYGFARYVDDLGDEAATDRLAALDWAEGELERAAIGTATDPLFRRLTPTLRTRHLPLDPFRRLIEANRVDQRVTSYATFEELLTYCQLSATPVGELVLAVFGFTDKHRIALSDAVCSALQVIEHCQDIREDLDRGRVYLPEEDRKRFGVKPADLAAPRAGRAVRDLVAFEVSRSRVLLGAGTELVSTVPGRARIAIAGYTAGGLAACDAMEAAGYDVLARSCQPRRTHRARLAAALLLSANRILTATAQRDT
jgi:squalene synthase HpnC